MIDKFGDGNQEHDLSIDQSLLVFVNTPTSEATITVSQVSSNCYKVRYVDCHRDDVVMLTQQCSSCALLLLEVNNGLEIRYMGLYPGVPGEHSVVQGREWAVF
jgi:hypothetical protein